MSMTKVITRTPDGRVCETVYHGKRPNVQMVYQREWDHDLTRETDADISARVLDLTLMGAAESHHARALREVLKLRSTIQRMIDKQEEGKQ